MNTALEKSDNAYNTNEKNKITPGNLLAKMFDADDELVRRILEERDRYAAEKLVERHYKNVYKEIYFKVNDEELAKDLTQDTFIAILKNLEKFDSKAASFKTWITTIAKNKVIDNSRSKAYKQQMMTETLEDYERETEENVENEAVNILAAEKIEGFMKNEDEVTRDIFYMRANQGYEFKEIADLKGLSVSQVKNRYYGIIKHLRKEMQDYE